MALSAQQERFAQSIASGMEASEAYRAVYKAAGMSGQVVAREAGRLLAHAGVGQRIAELRTGSGAAVAPLSAVPETGATTETPALWTRLDSVRALAEIATHAESKPGERMSAIKELNAMYGFGAPVRVDSGAGFELHVHFDEVVNG